MPYYLSKTNKYIILPFLRLLKHPEKGKVELPSNDSDSLLKILKNAAYTEHPELRFWRFKKIDSETVLAIPKLITLKAEINAQALDYIDLIDYLTINKINRVLFTQVNLNEKEFNRLLNFGEFKKLTITRDDLGIYVISRRDEDTQTDRGNEG